MKKFLNNWIFIVFLISLIAITSALIAEHIFGFSPCKLCIKQRYGYYVIITLITLFYLFRFKKNIFLAILIEFSIFYGLFYSLWHLGIEQKILTGPKSCAGMILNSDSIENLKNQILNQPIINCSEITWIMFGLSAATINSLVLILILFFNTMYIKSNLYDSEKNN